MFCGTMIVGEPCDAFGCWEGEGGWGGEGAVAGGCCAGAGGVGGMYTFPPPLLDSGDGAGALLAMAKSADCAYAEMEVESFAAILIL